MKFNKKYISVPVVASIALFMAVAAPFVRPAIESVIMLESAPTDTTMWQSAEDVDLRYPIAGKTGIPTVDNEKPASSIDLNDPKNMDYSVEYDAKTNTITMYRKVGGMDVRLPYTMTLEEYQNDDVRQSMINYWNQKQRNASVPKSIKGDGSVDSDRNSLLNSKWKVNSDLFASVFGSNQVTMKLQGQASLKIGVQWTKINNPTLQERMRKTTSFDFDQTIQMNLNASIGERMKLGINYNTEATFDFENQVKLDYTGTEDDIIQDIEAGNITWTLPGTLIQGSQSLFGVKTDLKFGKLSVSTVFSQKKGETSSVSMQGGAQATDFEMDITDYEKNKHFFLSHKFKEMYDNSLKSLPIVNSPITITKVEVWITNTGASSTDTRNILAFIDMGETGDNLTNNVLWNGAEGAYPANEANNLYNDIVNNYGAARVISTVTATLSGLNNFRSGRDFEKLENARLLNSSEYTVNEKLGYISLNTALNSSEVLSVAYQYTYRGKIYKVGEFSTSGVDAPNCLYTKLLKGTTLTPKYKTWSLMMKNIYSLGAYDVESDNFDLNVVYYNDSTSSYINYFNEGPKPSAGGQNGKTYLQIFNLDNLNSNLDGSADGKYDFIEGYTVIASKGRIIFPQREPFGSYIADVLKHQPSLAKKYAFTALYDSTLVYAKQQKSLNKYKISGSYQSSGSSEISLNAVNVAQGSVIVTAGGVILTENVDYTVDYTLGRVRILNQGLLNSGTTINVSYENQSAISTQTQTYLGAHFNYQFNDNFNMGATVIHMNETALTNKVNYGDEAVSNTMLGLNMSYAHELPIITKLLDALPLVSTKEKSEIQFEGEVAKLIAGHNSSINASYIDDFEGASVSYDVKNWTAWKLASIPQGQNDLFPNADLIDDLSVGFERARLAWYTIDPLFLRNVSTTPKHIKNDPQMQSNHYVREVYEEELFPNRETAYGEATNISVLNLAYYPNERGSYNFTTNITKEGFLNKPEEKWAGIQRKVDPTDFETANIEYIEFWMLDPFIYNKKTDPSVGGELYFNLGTVSEDVLRDSRRSFEHGLPTPDEAFLVDSTAWGYVPQNSKVTNAFNTDPASMLAQDVGLNGMSSARERYFYRKTGYPYLNIIEQMHADGNLTDEAYDAIMNDPAGDDYHYYRGSDYDQIGLSILDRYKRFNNTEGNSCPSEYSPETYSTASLSLPDNEDLNSDYTLNETENYYQYVVSVRPDSMVVGKNYIADMLETTVSLKNGNTDKVKWYQFKIPVKTPDKVVGDISDLSSVQFMRMFVKNFSDTCIMRFATMELVRGEWRKYTENLWEDGTTPVAQTQFTTSTVNIEENDSRTPVNYVLPPGIDRVVDPSNPQLRQLNEQAYSMKVIDLGNGDSRAIFKSVGLDLRNFKRLKMYVHAEAVDGYPLEDNQMAAFVRLGTDYDDNYYEYEIPLKLTPHGVYSDNNESDRYIVWPEENELNIPTQVLTKAKLQRNEAKRAAGSTLTYQDIFSITDPDNTNNRVRIKGNPSLGAVQTIMIGVRARGAGQKAVEVWVNELRLSDFNESGGWAARGRTTIKLADLGSVSAAGQYSSVGWGSVDQSVTERSMESNAQFDISANLELGKLLGPESPVSVPFYAGYSRSVSTPEYYPYDSDVLLKTVLDQPLSSSEKDSIKSLSQTTETTKSLNLTNVRMKQPKGVPIKIYSPSNLSASYSYTETKITDPETQYDTNKEFNGSLGYSYSLSPKPIEPFKGSKLNSKMFALIKDFNFYYKPTLVSYRWELARNYQEVQKRNVTNPDYVVPVSVSKDFDWNRYFDLRYNFSRSLKLSVSAVANARIDEPDGPVNKDLYRDEYKHWRDSVWSNIFKFGRITNYQHSGDISYNIPVNKLPYLDFLSASAQYKGVYNWTAGYQNIETDYEWGNTIKNRNTKQLNGMANFTNLYNKSDYLKSLYKKYNTTKKKNNKSRDDEPSVQTVRYTENNVDIKAGQTIVINHRLRTMDVSIRAFDGKGKTIKGQLVPLTASKAEFTSNVDATNARLVVIGTIQEEETPLTIVKEYAFLTLTSLKNISVNYSENNSTTLPGYMPGSHFLGMESYNGSRAPGFAFIAGWQDRDFAMKAVRNGWLTTDTTLNSPYLMTRSKDLSIRAIFEPFKGLRLELSSSRTHSVNMSEYYVYGSGGFDGVYNTVETGSFSMTYSAIGTAFKKVEKNGALEYAVFDEFLANRQSISSRMGAKHVGESLGINSDGAVEGYGLTSQNVLIPAFVAAYSGGNRNSVFTDIIPSVGKMKPNWKLTFSGLSDVSWLKDIVRSVDITHSYQSTYTVNSFVTNLDWLDNGNGLTSIRDLHDNFVPQFDVTAVTLSDQFNPLLQISAVWLNNVTTTVDIKRTRTMSLSMSNNQVSETYNREYGFDVGYRFDKLNMIFGKGSNAKQVNSDLNLKFGLNFRDNFTILRKIEELSNELTAGSHVTTVKFSADYAFSSKFSMQFYYDQNISNPYISSTYPTNNVNVGFSFQLSLSQ